MKNTACSGNGYKTAQKTERSVFTRMCIGEAIIELMQDKGMNGVNVSAIAKKSGVSRMTFYYYYDSVQEALTDYMKEIVADYLKARKNTPGLGNYQEYSHVVFSLKFFDQYKTFFLTMTQNGLHSILMDGINEFMLSYLPKETVQSLYDIYYYAGGLLNTFLKWEENGQRESAEKIARIICQHTRV